MSVGLSQTKSANVRCAEDRDEREQFIEQFWLRRDPDPDTDTNEYREEYYTRIAYANEHFTSGVPGSKTERRAAFTCRGNRALRTRKSRIPQVVAMTARPGKAAVQLRPIRLEFGGTDIWKVLVRRF